jgi:hypothetical protein
MKDNHSIYRDTQYSVDKQYQVHLYDIHSIQLFARLSVALWSAEKLAGVQNLGEISGRGGGVRVGGKGKNGEEFAIIAVTGKSYEVGRSTGALDGEDGRGWRGWSQGRVGDRREMEIILFFTIS